MTSADFPALDPFGRALMAHWQGDRSAVLHHEFRSGRTVDLPVSLFFRGQKEFYPTEMMLDQCQGRVLVIGAGTGVHAIPLIQAGHEVTALEVCPQAVEILRARGIDDVRSTDFFQFRGSTYDTLLMLGHNIGICGTLDRIPQLLTQCRALLNPGGQLLVNSVDESGAADADNQGYPGELEFRLTFDGITGPWMPWLHLGYNTLAGYAQKCGWTAQRLVAEETGEFLARLCPRLVSDSPADPGQSQKPGAQKDQG